MRILSCDIENFSSYKLLQFKFDGQGLTLISGPTGSGKSTLCDIIPWVLFGKTSKNGAVDEVLSWPGGKSTFGRIQIELSDKIITITRERGRHNDIYYQLSTHALASIFRGKDLNDTQKIINDVLGFDIELYLSGSYFHEFSQTAQFFTTTAKIRRQISEQIVDLSLAKNLTERMSEYKKEVKKEQLKLTEILQLSNCKLQITNENHKLEASKSEKWLNSIVKKLDVLTKCRLDFKNQQTKAFGKELTKYYERRLELESSIVASEKDITPQEDIDKRKKSLEVSKLHSQNIVCGECGNVKNRDKELSCIKEEYSIKKLEALNAQKIVVYKTFVQSLKKHIQQEPQRPNSEENPYTKQIEDLSKEENPHTETLNRLSLNIQQLTLDINKLNAEISSFIIEGNDLELLLQVTDDFRKVLVNRTIMELENSTNKILTDHFDAEIRIGFASEVADKLDVTIWKDGNQCSYTQLSKGQRQLLKLSFGVSVMRCVGNHHGIQFNCIWLDEALDGLDENLKIKSYGLLQQLEIEYGNVFVVEHSNELKALFTNRYDVTLTEKGSQLEQA